MSQTFQVGSGDTMREEYNFTLTLPLAQLDRGLMVLQQAGAEYPQMRVSRKPDRQGMARFYLCFPYQGARLDLRFKEWFEGRKVSDWDLFGPNYGVWGLS
jgi:hypothetical protein